MMKLSRAARWTLGAAVVLLAQLALPLSAAEPAWALPGLTLVQVPGPTNSDNKGQAAPCPKDRVVIGGGAKVTGPGQDYVHLGTLQPQEQTNSFGVLAWEIEPGTNLACQITAFAICITRPQVLHYVHQDTNGVGSSATIQLVEAVCPAGTNVIGMGAYVTGGGQVLLQALYPTSTERVRAYASEDFNGYAKNWGIGAWAVCADSLAQPTWVASAQDGENPKVAMVECDKSAAHSAGFVLGGAAGRVLLTDLIPSGDHTVVVAAGAEDPLGTESNWLIVAHTTCAP